MSGNTASLNEVDEDMRRLGCLRAWKQRVTEMTNEVTGDVRVRALDCVVGSVLKHQFGKQNLVRILFP